jgi:hypothetical protein
MNTDAAKGWMISTIVLAIVVVILLIMMWSNWNSRHDLDTVLNNGSDNVAAMKAQIQTDCQGANADQARCDADLNQLSDVLKEFSANLTTATPAASSTGGAGY